MIDKYLSNLTPPYESEADNLLAYANFVLKKNKPMLKGRHYNIAGMGAGQQFLGCPKCGFQRTSPLDVVKTCLNCHKLMDVLTVTEEDLEKGGKKLSD